MNLSALNQLVRHFGLGWVFYRAWKSAGERLGYWKFKLPSKPWQHFGTKKRVQTTDWKSADEFFRWRKKLGTRFFFDPSSIASAQDWLCSLDTDHEWAAQTLSRISAGEFPFFSSRWINIGCEPDWFINPYNGKAAPRSGHFSYIDEFGFGDVKAIWEPSRFAFVFYLARSFARTGNPKCGEEFWRLVDHWMDANPPYEGINWKCGQESGLRILAAIFGLFAFAKTPATTTERLQRFVLLVSATGNRIEKHIRYAISQKNNHGISEAVALWSIGILFPEIKAAKSWQARGHKVLAQLCDELIYDDGAFSQHSANYHQLILHLLAWTVRLAEVNHVQLDKSISRSLQRATDFIGSLIVSDEGLVPRYGNDDGALILPLNHCDYFDFRPIVQLCRWLVHGQRTFASGPWDEDLIWFGFWPKDHFDPIPDQETPSIQSFPEGGCHVIKLNSSVAFVRAGKFKHRPAQSDLLHVDIWWKSHNITLDPGTYSYNGDGIWNDIPLMQSCHHNTVIVDGREPENRVSKFLLLPWNESELVAQTSADRFLGMEWKRTLNHGLAHPVIHHRAVLVLPDDVIAVWDALWSAGEHQYQLGWLLGGELVETDSKHGIVELRFAEDKYWVKLGSSIPSDLDCVSGHPGSARGWYAPRYLELKPALSCHLAAKTNNILFQSVFSPTESSIKSQITIPLFLSAEPQNLLDSDCLHQVFEAIHA